MKPRVENSKGIGLWFVGTSGLPSSAWSGWRTAASAGAGRELRLWKTEGGSQGLGIPWKAREL